VRLRPAAARDHDFLFRVYASTRAEELAVVDWTDAQKAAFLAMQFEAQTRAYASTRPTAVHHVIVVDGEDAGRLIVDRSVPADIEIVDVALLPAFRGRGVGAEVIGGVLAEADRDRRRTLLYVEKVNRAQALYARLGFRPERDEGIYILLARPPAA
jgi:ribosomal protein S18 acetylase RimI-like enzyme